MKQQKKKPGRPPGKNNKNKKGTKSALKNVDENSLRKEREIQSLVIIAIGVFLAIAMFFNVTGVVGEAFESFFKGCFGAIAFVLPFYLIAYGVLMIIGRTKVFGVIATIFFVVLIFDIAIGNSVRFVNVDNPIVPILGLGDVYGAGTELKNGGLIGMCFATLLVKAVGVAGTYIFVGLLALISVILIADKPYSGMISFRKSPEERAEKKLLKEQKEEEKRQLKKEKEQKEAWHKDTQEMQLDLSSIEKKRNGVEREEKIPYQFPDYRRTSKAIKKARLAENQKKILGYMIDDSLAVGKGEKTAKSGFGLEGEEEPIEAITNGLGLNEGYSEGDMGHEELSYTSHYEDYRNNDEANEEEESEKLTNAQAAAASLSKDEFNTKKTSTKYTLPPTDLLKSVTVKGADLSDLAAKTKKLEQTLESFNVDAKVVDAIPGPAVTRYEIHPNPGVKVSSIVRLSNDIALNLEAKSIRIEAPIPGKAAVGIEVENDKINLVTIREIIDSKEFKTAKSKISFAVGKDIAGKAIIGDLKSMPHLLIAGSTGAGKSVCINSIIASILYKAKPDEVKLVMVDPKVVELGNYNGIPHLLIPVVTEPSKAAAALNWAVAEMNDRYKKFAAEGVRDLESYNESVKKNKEEKMPQVVIIIDELADLMMAAPSQVEDSICRLAQMARAAGMHLIVATQRPSVDVITGVIKANIPSRIAFAVSSQVDSRTILDMSGAEKLVGKGDMLYNPLGMGKPIRVQGTFISDKEVKNIIDYVKEQTEEVEYSEDIIDTIEKTDIPAEIKSDNADELLPECIELVVQSGQASVSMLQRRFRIGYNRAARIIDMMEERGIVGPADGSRPRQVFVTEDELNGADSEEKEK